MGYVVPERYETGGWSIPVFGDMVPVRPNKERLFHGRPTLRPIIEHVDRTGDEIFVDPVSHGLFSFGHTRRARTEEHCDKERLRRLSLEDGINPTIEDVTIGGRRWSRHTVVGEDRYVVYVSCAGDDVWWAHASIPPGLLDLSVAHDRIERYLARAKLFGAEP